MSNIFTPMPITNGLVPATVATLLAAPGGTNYYVKQFTLFNEDQQPQTILVYLAPSGGSAGLYRRFVLQMNQSAKVLEHGESLTLNPGDAIQAITSPGGVVDYTMTGVQEV